MADKTTVNIPKPMVQAALKLAARSAARAAATQTAKYGPDHIIVQTLADEARTYANATIE